MKRFFHLLVTAVLLTAMALTLVSCGWGKKKEETVGTRTETGGQFNILLLGVDTRPGEKTARADSIVLVNVNWDTQLISFLSIPRDTRVEIPGHGWQKINSATTLGGVKLMRQVVEDLVDVQIAHYVLTNFDGFKDIVDTLGGVNIDVDQDMHYKGIDITINLKKGEQRLDGDKALQYVRYRQYALGDIDRTQHQLKFLQALVKESLQLKTVPKLPRLIPEIRRAVKTDMGIKEMLTMVKLQRDLDSSDILTQTLPGEFLTLDGVSYWQVDPAEAREVTALLLAGVTTPKVVKTSPVAIATAGSSYKQPSGDQNPVTEPAIPGDEIPEPDGTVANPPTDDVTLPGGTEPPAGDNQAPGGSTTNPGDQNGAPGENPSQPGEIIEQPPALPGTPGSQTPPPPANQ